MKMLGTLARILILTSSLATASANATVIFSTNGNLTANDPTQLGRLSRNGVPQDWAGIEPFPGVINPTAIYHFHTYLINVGLTPFIQINFDSNAATTFVSAYQTTYNPGNLATNWLGDAGGSGNFFGFDPRFFNVVAALNSQLVVVINEPTPNGGLGSDFPFGLLVEGFCDRDFTDAPCQVTTVPEPSTLMLSFAAVSGLVIGRRRRRASM